MKEWMTIDELCGYLRVGRRAIYAMSERGDLPCFKVGNRLRFERGEIDVWMESKRRRSIDPDVKAAELLAGRKCGKALVEDIVDDAIASVTGMKRKVRPDRGH